MHFLTEPAAFGPELRDLDASHVRSTHPALLSSLGEVRACRRACVRAAGGGGGGRGAGPDHPVIAFEVADAVWEADPQRLSYSLQIPATGRARTLQI